jgi:hypothetical protein
MCHIAFYEWWRRMSKKMVSIFLALISLEELRQPMNILIQISCFLTFYIVLSLFKNCHVYFSKHNVSETEFCLRLQVKPTQLGPIDRASPYLLKTETESSLRNVVFLKINRTVLDKTMDNVKKHNICTNVPSSQTFRSYNEYNVRIVGLRPRIEPGTFRRQITSANYSTAKLRD